MHRDQQSGQDILQIICSVCFSPDPIIYTQNTLNIRHVGLLLLLFFKSLMLIAILPLYEEARVGHLKKKKTFYVPKKEEGHTALEQEKR